MNGNTGTRERLVRTAARLFQERGYAATGLSEILAASGTPKGSLYHHFPGGKEDLAIAAAELAGGQFLKTLKSDAASSASTAELVIRFGERLAGWLDQSGYTVGCPLATLALEQAPHSPALSDTVATMFTRWQDALADRLRADGIEETRADRLALLILSGIEGALILSRARRDGAPLRESARTLARLIETGASGWAEI